MCTLPKIGGPDHPLTPSLTKEGDFGPHPDPLLNQGGELRVFLLLKGPGYALHSVRRLLLLTRSTLLARRRSRGPAQPAGGAA